MYHWLHNLLACFADVMNTMTKWDGKGLFQITGFCPSLREDRAWIQAGTEASNVEEYCLLARSESLLN